MKHTELPQFTAVVYRRAVKLFWLILVMFSMSMVAQQIVAQVQNFQNGDRWVSQVFKMEMKQTSKCGICPALRFPYKIHLPSFR